MEQQSSDRSAAASARVMVAIGINPSSQRLMDAAVRLTHGLGGDLLAVHIRHAKSRAGVYQANLDWNIQHAQSLGAKVEIISGGGIAKTLVAYAQAQGVTHLVLGQSEVSRWHEIRYGSIVNQILREIARQGAGIDLYIVTSSLV